MLQGHARRRTDEPQRLHKALQQSLHWGLHWGLHKATFGSGTTTVLFRAMLWLCSLIGLLYHDGSTRAQSHVLNPAFEPFILVPAFSTYPSNQTFQSHLIAEVFTRAVPEHSGGPALCHAAGEVAKSGEWAGLHVRSDTEGGRSLARLCAPKSQEILDEQIRDVRAEWIGEGHSYGQRTG